MRLIRLLLLLLSIAVAIAFALLRPLPARAVRTPAPGGPNPTSTEDPPLLPPVAGVTTAEALAPKPRAHRKLAAARHANRSLHFGLEIVRYAKHLLGAPYRYGGTSPRSGFDCSGFVRYVYSHFGISLPHSSFGDLVEGRRVGRSALHPGDLVFFDGAGHVGIYVGNEHFIHAPHTGTVVSISTMSGWYSTRYVGARRLR